ncbi:MAG TPA: hypothetical protein VJ831_03955 [Jatrophihabitantaceae bacterium]|nr:hypothetical protein [Jatrophihabitantaceae bacterium]
MCLEIGRRLLLAELEFSEWILRRVEKIAMEQDRSVSRSIALEFSVRDDAPEFVLPDGDSCRLVPLTVMRRQTLVNLELRDAHDGAVLMPGMRLTQQLDQSVMLAAAATVDRSLVHDARVRQFVQLAIYGELPAVAWAYRRFDTAPDGPLADLRADPLFRFAAERFRFNFTLYMFADSRCAPTGAHLVRMSFNEHTHWRHQKPVLEAAESPEVYRYRPGDPDRMNFRRSMAAVGMFPTRVRFQIPGAECAASYHCEIAAPDGLAIVKATLLAGRPNDPQRHTSMDTIVGHTPVAGLHAVEIPNGSLCRVQVDFGIPARGWLTAVFLSTVAIAVVLLSVAWHWQADAHLNHEQITNVVLILITTSAAVAGLVAQRDSGSVAARFFTSLRAGGTLALLLPLFVAGLLAYSGLAASVEHPTWMRVLLWLAFGVAAAIAVVFALATFFSTLAQRQSIARESPWDQTRHPKADHAAGPPDESTPDFLAKVTEQGFDSAAVGIVSAEGWHERYAWNDTLQAAAVARLHKLGHDVSAALPNICTRPSAPDQVAPDDACHGCISVGLPLADRGDGPQGVTS